MRAPRALLLLTGILVSHTIVHAATDPYEAMAVELTSAATQSGARSAQFLPLVSAEGGITPEGRMLSGKVLAYLVAQMKMSIVLGSMPESVLEPYLETFDARDGRELRRRLKPGELPRSDVVIMGSYMVVRDKIKVNLQTIEVASGRILAATSTDVHNDWVGLSGLLCQTPNAHVRASLIPELRAVAIARPIAAPLSGAVTESTATWHDTLDALTMHGVSDP